MASYDIQYPITPRSSLYLSGISTVSATMHSQGGYTGLVSGRYRGGSYTVNVATKFRKRVDDEGGDSVMIVKFCKRVAGAPQESDIYLYHAIEMPFVPPIGMLVTDGDWECNVNELAWDHETNGVDAWAIPDQECRAFYPSDTVEERAKFWEEGGWKREGA